MSPLNASGPARPRRIPLVPKHVASRLVAPYTAVMGYAFPADPPSSERDLSADPPRLRFWIVFGALSFTATLFFSYRYLGDFAVGRTDTWPARLIDEFGGSYTAIPFVYAIAAFHRRFPLRRGRWAAHLPLHVVAVLAYSLLHTSLSYGLRGVLYPLAGLGPYMAGLSLPLHYAMELPNDVAVYVAAGAVLMLIGHYRALRAHEVQSAELARSLAQAQLENLRLQLQPHFLFNALNAISSTMYDDPARADELLGQLAELLRHSLRSTHVQEVPLAEEIQGLRQYVALMQARFGDALAVDIDVPPDAGDLLVPSLVLQPLVENAVRHGNATRTGRGRIAVTATRDDGRLRLGVRDDGPGAPPGRDVLRAGIGLSRTATRLRMLYGDEGHRFQAGNDGGGFHVRIELPARSGVSMPA